MRVFIVYCFFFLIFLEQYNIFRIFVYLIRDRLVENPWKVISISMELISNANNSKDFQ